MKKKIAILGSTGSIGKTTLEVISHNKKNYDIKLLTTNKNISKIIKQSRQFNVKNIIITDNISYQIAKKKLKNNRKIKIYNDFSKLDKIFKNKIDYVMSSITGIAGLSPTLKIIKYTNSIGIANKETIICAWNLIKKELKKNNTFFFPIDSEHFFPK